MVADAAPPKTLKTMQTKVMPGGPQWDLQFRPALRPCWVLWSWWCVRPA